MVLTCFYCGCELLTETEIQRLLCIRRTSIIEKLLPGPQPRPVKYMRATKDHKTPRMLTKGQPNNEVVWACAPCNYEKRELTLEEYRVVKAFRYGYISGVEYKFAGEQQ